MIMCHRGEIWQVLLNYLKTFLCLIRDSIPLVNILSTILVKEFDPERIQSVLRILNM